VVGLKVNNNYSIHSRLIKTMAGAGNGGKWLEIMIMEGTFPTRVQKVSFLV
jgi:hypothetical protein